MTGARYCKLERLHPGEGPGRSPVVFVHGFPDSLQLWREVAPRLVAAGYRVVAVDQLGFGESDAPAGRHHYVIDRLVGDAAVVLGELDVTDPVHVIGHDWGAVVA